jgi:tricorn protease
LKRLALVTGLLAFVSAPTLAQDIRDTRMLSQPAVSASHVAFTYAGDLWITNRDGSDARRLTTHPGTETNPRFSPDGRWIAFSGQYDGNTDVFLVPAAGGAPQRLTWHPAPDVVQDFTPDGTAVLFNSQRNSFSNRYAQLYTISVEGGHPTQLPIPNAFKASYAPDGQHIAYTPLYEPFNQWKNYRGGTQTRIWVYDVNDHSVVEIPKPDDGSNDTDPMWVGGTVFFRSDRAGEFNLFSFDPATGRVEQHTDFGDFPIINASTDGTDIAFEQAGYLHVLSPAAGTTARLTIGVAADLLETRPRYATGDRFIRNAHISPSGARAVFEFRGEIVTAPAEKGDHRQLTHSSDSHERSPAWSPDGKTIAYFSDAGGEYRLHIAPADGKGEVRQIPVEGHGFYEDPVWSPDGAKIAYTDNAWSLYVLDVASGQSTTVASEPLYGPFKLIRGAWSPDSRWLAYTLGTGTGFRQVYIYSVEDERSHAITEGLGDVNEPVFDASGKYLYFFASTDAGPLRDWFAMSNNDMEVSGTLYLAVLAAGVESPLKKESDEEVAAESEEGESEGSEGEEEEEEDDESVRIDLDGISQRVVTIPVGNGYFTNLQPGPEGTLYYLRGDSWSPFAGGSDASLRKYDLGERKEETLLDDADAFAVSADGKKVLVRSGSAWHIADAGGKIDPSKGRLSTGDLQVKIDPRQEWTQIFHEAWRINRDYFYDPDMHGADWPAMREKYEPFLPHLATRSDLNRLLQWMHSELAVGHHGVGGGDFLNRPQPIPGGLLGADYEVDGDRYRVAKVYGGLNWNPELRAPLTEPGVDLAAGEYLLAVNGVDLRYPENLYSRFETTAGKAVEITVGPDRSGSNSRTVTVVPVRSEFALRNRDWVEGNIRKVHEATDGRVAYVYVPNTTTLGHTYFKRYFFPQADKEALIVDERFNGGGQAADYYIDVMRRPYTAHWAMRYGEDLKMPTAIHGPKVVLIDETAGSGGDLFPWMFRKFGLGTLIGKRTWGGLVGILGFPVLLDGGGITAPNVGIWVEDTRHRSRAVAGGRDRRPRPATGAWDRGNPAATGSEPAAHAPAAAVPRSGATAVVERASRGARRGPGRPPLSFEAQAGQRDRAEQTWPGCPTPPGARRPCRPRSGATGMPPPRRSRRPPHAPAPPATIQSHHAPQPTEVGAARHPRSCTEHGSGYVQPAGDSRRRPAPGP